MRTNLQVVKFANVVDEDVRQYYYYYFSQTPAPSTCPLNLPPQPAPSTCPLNLPPQPAPSTCPLNHGWLLFEAVISRVILVDVYIVQMECDRWQLTDTDTDTDTDTGLWSPPLLATRNDLRAASLVLHHPATTVM